MRSYKFHKEDERTSDDKIAENERMMKEFLKKGANPDGEVVFMVLYYVNKEGTSTAAVLTMPNDPSACVLYISYDVTLAPQKKENI